MAKSTQAEATITRQKILDAALDITLNKGFKFVTLGNLAKEVGITRSGINGHFKKKEDLIEIIIPILSKILEDPLDFSSTDAFYASWISALNSNKNFSAAVHACGPVIPPQKGMNGLIRKIDADYDDAMNCVFKCIGYAVYYSE